MRVTWEQCSTHWPVQSWRAAAVDHPALRPIEIEHCCTTRGRWCPHSWRSQASTLGRSGDRPAAKGRGGRQVPSFAKGRRKGLSYWRTSNHVCCHQCEGLLMHATAFDHTLNKSDHIHHVLSCSECKNSKGCRQFWHREFNAAKNIPACYMAEARGEERPQFLRR